MSTFTNLPTRRLYILLGFGFALLSASVVQAQTITWTGSINNQYNTPGNWDLGYVPTDASDVVIPAGITPQPGVFSPAIASAKTLTIASGASLTVNGEIILYGNLTNDGTFSGTGKLTIKGPNSLVLGGSSTIPLAFHNVSVETQASAPSGAILRRPMTVTGLLSLNRNLTVDTGGSLTLISTPGPTGTTAFVENRNSQAEVIGTVTVQRAIDGSVNSGLGYRHYSSPVSGNTINDLITTPGFTSELNSAYNISLDPYGVTPFPNVFGYDQSRLYTVNNNITDYDKGFFVPSATDPMTTGAGYAVNISASALVDFTGTLNNGTYFRQLARNAANTANSANAGWHLLGNPYPSPLNWSLIDVADRPNLEGAIYVIRSTGQYTDGYRSYVNGVGNPVVAVGQGFFARVAVSLNGNGQQQLGGIRFKNTHRVTGTDNTTFQRITVDTRPKVEMALQGSNSLNDVATVYFENGSTAGTDSEYDAVKLPNTSGLNLTTLATDGKELAIDGRPVLTAQLTVPMRVYVPTNGSYTLRASELANLSGMRPYLHDLLQGTFIDLTQQASYTFTQNAANTTPRFELVFALGALATAPAVLAQQVALYPNPAQKAAFVELPASIGNHAITATLVDAMGRTLRTVTLPAQGIAAHKLSVDGLAAGVYTLRLNTAAGVVAKRLVIE